MTEHTGPRLLAGVERTTWRWTIAVMSLATVVLAAYLALVLATVWVVGSAIEAVGARDLGGLDVEGLAVDALPGVVGGWFAGLGAATLLSRIGGLRPRGVGLWAGLVGVVVGAALLAATGIL